MPRKNKALSVSEKSDLQLLLQKYGFSLRRIAGEAKVPVETIKAALSGRTVPSNLRYRIVSYLDSVYAMATTNPLISNPVLPGCSRAEYIAYGREKKALGWPRQKVNRYWRQRKCRARKLALMSRSPSHAAAVEIYDLADQVLGHSDFLHSQGALDVQDDHTIRLDLPKSKGRGWNISDVDRGGAPLKAFAAGVKKIKAKYKKYGLSLIVARTNPRFR